jgi:hypothetical protein
MLRIQQTTNYDQFFFIKGNRPVRPAALIASVQQKNMLDSHPIIVSDMLGESTPLRPYGIIDGQHRLKAAEELKVPIFFMVDPKLTEKDIPICQIENPWSFHDYLQFFEIENKNYQFVRRIMQKNSLPIHFVVEKVTAHIEPYKHFRLGTFVVKKNEDLLCLKFDYIGEMVKLAKIDHSSNVHNKALKAMWTLVSSDEYNHRKMMDKMTKYKDKYFHALSFKDVDNVHKQLRALYRWYDKARPNQATEDFDL